LKRLKTKELSGLSDKDLVARLNDLRSELSQLRSSAARGTLKKELGEIKTVRRNIARLLTEINAKKKTVVPLIKSETPIVETDGKEN
jgi:large subunit ribosomal protein L29